MCTGRSERLRERESVVKRPSITQSAVEALSDKARGEAFTDNNNNFLNLPSIVGKRCNLFDNYSEVCII